MCLHARRRRRAPRALPVAFALAAALAAGCAPAPRLDMPERRAPGFAGPLPPMQSFTAAPARPTARGNRQLAQDFLELSFEMESGRALPRFTRFEGPVRVALRGPADAQLSRDLDGLLARLRREAGIDIARARPGTPANLVVEVLPRRQLQRAVPEAACFVVPRVTSWEAFLAARRSRQVDWTTLEERTAAAVFLPGDVSPQEARDCLHEEIAQALGPLNDLYRLPESVFNDDNFHTVLTGFDMLMLRITYDRALQSGLGRAEVASRLPGILARANPAGAGAAGPLDAPSPRDWVRAIETALGPRGRPAPRRAAAREAVKIADREGWRDGRRAFSLYVYGRLALGEEPEQALQAFLEAASIYAGRPEMAVQRAHVGMQLAAFSLTAGQLDPAVEIVDAHADTVRDAENAALLATLLLIKAEALAAGGETARAEALRREALGWARYGFGADEIVRARAGEIARLAPRRVEGEALAARDTRPERAR